MTEEKRRRRRKAARPHEILDAAVEVFAEQGFAAAKVDEIARRAGIAKGTIYLYYRTKEELFEAMVRARIAPVFSRLDQLTLHPDISAAEVLELVIRNIYRSIIHSPERRVIMKLIISEGSQFPQLVAFYHREILAGAEAMLRRIVARGIERGEFRAGAATAEPRVLIGPAMMAAVWQMTFAAVAPLDEARYTEAHIDLLLHGILVDKPPGDSASTSPRTSPTTSVETGTNAGSRAKSDRS